MPSLKTPARLKIPTTGPSSIACFISSSHPDSVKMFAVLIVTETPLDFSDLKGEKIELCDSLTFKVDIRSLTRLSAADKHFETLY